MIPRSLLIGAFVWFAFVGVCQAVEDPPSSYTPHPAVYTRDQLTSDFAVCEGALREMHGGLFAHRTPAEIDAAFARARSRLSSSGSERTLFLALSELLGVLGDGHTSVRMSSAAIEFFERQPVYLPLRLVHLDGRTFVRHDCSDLEEDLVGAEVLDIAGREMDAVLAEMIRHTPGDGDNLTGRYSRLSDPVFFGRLYQYLYGPTSAITVRLLTVDGVDRTVVFPLVTGPRLDELFELRYPEDYQGRGGGELTFANDGGAAVMRLSVFAGSGLPGALDRWFAEIDVQRPGALILDLRDNGGGLEIYGQRLLGHLLDHPFLLYQRAEVNARSFSYGRFSANNPTIFEDGDVVPAPDGRWLLTPQRRQFLAAYEPRVPQVGQDTKLIVLVNGGTFSTAADVVTAIDQERDAVFIGEEAGGGYHGNTSGSTKTIFLPHTKIRLRVPIERYITTESDRVPHGRGLLPDHVVRPSPADLRSGGDPALDLALDLAR